MISVIVPVYNGAQTIASCLKALLNQTVPRSQYEVIVVDDGSTDETREVVKRFDVRLLSQPNRGPAAARNFGASQARGEILLFTDADCVPKRDWIEAMLKPFADLEIVGAKGVYKTRQRELIARFVQIEYEDKYDKMRKDKYIDFVDTYSAAYRKTVFEENGGFDPTFPRASGEDVEFSYRLAQRGYKMVFVPQAVVYHRHVNSIGGYLRRKYYVGYWRVMMYRKHPQKVIRDSHTPQVLKIQVALSLLSGTSLFGAFLWKALLKWAMGFLILFFFSTLPFCIKALKKDFAVGLASPGILFLRAMALGLGVVAGLIAQFARRLMRYEALGFQS